jgi:hypothetical protein
MANKDGEMIPFDGEMAISEFKGKAIRKVFQDGDQGELPQGEA